MAMDEQTPQHPYQPYDSFDGGDLDCGSGLLLLIRQHIDPLTPGPAARDSLDRILSRRRPAGLVPFNQE